MVYDPTQDGSAEDAAAGFHTIGDVCRNLVERSAPAPISPQLLRPVRSEADARAAIIRSRLLRAIDALRQSGALDRELASELVAAVEGATS